MRCRPHFRLLLVAALMSLALLTFAAARVLAAPDAAESSITTAWRAVRARGGYHFSADVHQTTSPKASVTNVGRQSRTDTVHLEGGVDFEARAMRFTLWSQGGNVLDPDSGAQVRISEDGAFARQGDAGWQPVPDFSAAFAPDGDFLAYLHGARGIQEAERGRQGGIAYTRYTFELNGPALARRMRDQLQQQMTARGDLPAGISLALPELYAGMTGSGDLWLDADGLPMRQRLSLQFPEQDAQRVSADIDVSFSSAGTTSETGGALGAPIDRLRRLLYAGDGGRTVADSAAFALLLAGVFILLVGRHRSRRLRHAITVTGLVALVFTPLLQAAQAARAESGLMARRALQETAAKESEMQQRWRTFLTEPGADYAPTTTGDPSALQSPAAQDDPLNDLPLEGAATQTDSDRDGLTDYQEHLLGTNRFRADSDGDLLPDTLEVEGFEYEGRHWASNPLELDSNRDGLSDTREWLAGEDGDGMPGDTDEDGVPDLLDRDNDGDGVPDRLDISPFAVSASLAQDNPLGLTFSNLAPGRPTLVDFQLRPSDPDHLWYAFNVLDWPQGDSEGQMQDVDGKTFADVSGREVMGQEADGDLRLVPMLEIEIEGPLTHLPAASELKQMGMIVQTPRDEQGRARNDRPAHVYLPLRLVTDPNSRAQVAFEGTMLYRPEFDLWGTAHRVRLAWLVQALVDVCVDAGASETGCDATQNNQPQVLHVYYEPWQLTGLNVREDHGIELAVLYEDPAVDPEPHDDDALMMLAGGLAQTFLAGRDADEDGRPDLTPDEIAGRFALGSDASNTERWAVPDIVDVTRLSYEHRAQALATIVMTDTASILDGRFSPHVESGNAISPTLMFAREERFRAVNLDSQAGSDLVTWRGSNLTVDFNTHDVPLQTVAGLSWAPFRYNDEGQRWESFAIDEYWDLLESRYPFVEETDPQIAAGKQFALQLLYLSLYAGVSEPIQFDGMIPPDLRSESDEALTSTILSNALKGASYLVNGYVAFLLDVGTTVEGFTWRDWAKVKELVTKTDRELGLLFSDLKARFQSLSTFGKGAVIAALILLLAGLVLLAVFAFVTESLAARITVATIVGGLLLWLDVVSPIYSIIQGIRGLVTAETGFFSAARAWLATSSGQSAVNAAKFAAVLALVITLVVVWVDFFITINRHDFQAGSIPFNLLLSQAIAGTVVAVLALALVFAFPIVGTIVVGIIGVWDLIMTILGLDNLVLTNRATQFLADVFYGVNATIEEPDVTLQERELSLVEPSRGLVAGNALSVGATVLTEIEQNRPRHNVIAYRGSFYTDDYLNTTVFDYQLNTRPETEGQIWSRPGPWHPRRGEWYLGDWLWRGERESTVPAVTLPLDGAGINQVAAYDFRVRYDLPGWECWGISLLAYCDGRRIGGENGTVDTTIVLDVFPRTVEDFYALDWGAWQPAWDCPPDASASEYDIWVALDRRCEHGLSFPVQRDHDGDGLLAQAVGGLDPDDTRWDSDGDGLSDRFELELAQEGQGLALHLAADSDGDGLCDDQELRFGADPGLADSDGDGLLDGEEMLHQDRCDGDGDGDTTEWLGGWTFVYAVAGDGDRQQATIPVSSSPRLADSDGDGLGDLAEKQLHERNPLLYPYHPQVANETSLALYSNLSDGDRVLAPGQTAVYSATVRNSLFAPLYSAGALTVTLPGALGGERVTTPFNLYRQQEETVTRAVHVAPGSTSGEVQVAQFAGAQLHSGDGNPLFSWLPPRVTTATLAGDLPLVSARAAVPGLSWRSSQLLAMLRGQDETGACGGDVACSAVAVELVSIAPAGHVSETVTIDAFQDLEYAIAGKQPDLAFNSEGNGLLVYVRSTCEGQDCRAALTVMGALLAPGPATEPVPFPISVPGSDAPAARVEDVQVAADGSGFLVLWQERDVASGERTLRAARVSTDGVVSPWRAPALEAPQRLLDLVWSDGRYLLAWTALASADSHVLQLTALDDEVQVQAGAQYELSPSQPATAQARIATAPDGSRALVVYGGGETAVRARLLGGGDLSSAVTLWDGETASAPQVAYDASTRGWLASWLAADETGHRTLHYQALDGEGQPRLAPQAQPLDAPAAGLALSCGEQGTGCLAMVHEATTINVISLVLDPLATVIDRMLPLLIDADPPTSTITSLQNGQVISATGALVIGGLAADSTSRAAAVEVSINNQPCQDVVGAAVWAATCPVPELDGPAIITSRAQDLVGNRESQASQLTIILDRQPPPVRLAQTAPGQAVAAQMAGEGIWLLPLSGEAQDPAAGPVPGSGLARVEARLAWDRVWQAAEIDDANWHLNYRLPLFDPAFELLTEPTGSYTFTLRAYDRAGNVSLLPQQVVHVDNRPPVATLIIPAEEDRVISRALTLSGLLTETGSIQTGLSGLALALTEATAVVSPTTWLSAELARSGPGVISTTWSATLPPGLEGIYQIDVRGTDILNNRNDDRSTWTQWQGEIDVLAPRTAVTATNSGAGDSAQTLYQLWAEDFNLASTTFASVCPQAPVKVQTYSEPWWDEVIGDRTRIYSQTASCRVTGFQPAAVTIEACDHFGHCTLDSQAPPAAPQTPALHSAVLTPTHQTVLPDDAPQALIVGAHADDGLAAATVLLDGATVASRSWEEGPVDARWTTTWQPPGEGIFSLTSIVTDTVGRVQTDTVSTRVSVDLTPPQVSLATTIITATHRLAAGRVDLTGGARDAVGVAAVEVQIDDGPWLPAVIQGEEWIFPWQIGADPDGQGFAVAVRATDRAGRVDELRRRVVVDVRPPDPVTIELAHVESGGSRPLQPGDTVRASSAILEISWTGGTNGINTNTYLVGWSANPTPDASELTAYTGSGRHEQTVGGPQAVYAHLLIRDAYGNTTTQRLGTVIVDGPGTPDYVVDLAYDGWQREETTLVGVDWALARRAATGAALSAPQRLYASWDSVGLRLTWTGAQWNRDGDLFVYLDAGGTENSGASQLYNPYRGPNPTITLPRGFTADTVLQVEDSRGATLLRWDGDTWVTSSTLSADLFVHDPGAQPARSDLYLPFELLGVDDPEESGLALLAVASEEESLRIWATIPDKNPLNSERALAETSAPLLTGDFQLTQALSWATLGGGQTPNAGLQPGADLQLTIASDPPGAALAYLGSGLPQLRPDARLDENLNGRLDPSLPLDTEPPALADRTVVTYTIGYANRGAVTAEAVTIDVGAYGALTLPETAPQTVDLGNIAPGISGTVVLTASVNVSRTQNIASAELDVTVSDLGHGAFDWLWVQHDVDASPPEARITAPERVVPFGPLQFQGTVDGPADVADIIVAIRTWLPGDRALTFCTAVVIDGDFWACSWDPGEEALQELEEEMDDEAELIVQARASDVFDRRGDWSAPLVLIVDREPPQLALSPETTAFLSDGFLSTAELDLTGVISDTDLAGPLEVCLQDTPCQRLATTDGAWHVPVTAAADADGLPQRMTLQGFDAAGNRSETMVLDFRLDVRAPDLTITDQITTSAQSAVMTSVLSGTVREASGPPTVTVRIVPPSGPAQLEPVAVSDEAWHVALAPSVAGRYQLIVEARDRAGNIQMLPAQTLVAPATGSPSVPGPSLPETSTQVAGEFVRYLTSGGFIRLVVEPALPGLWSQVQWRDTAGRWHDVDGWQGGYTRNNEVLWWVSQKDLGTGPYRWLIAAGPGGPVLAYSDPFLVPDRRGEQTTITLTLKTTLVRPR